MAQYQININLKVLERKKERKLAHLRKGSYKLVRSEMQKNG
jgi:hypothetical protein